MILRTSVAPLVLALVLLAGALLTAQRPTPVLRAFERVQAPGGSTLHVLVEPDRGVGWRLGMAFQCPTRGRPVVAAFLGPFPSDRRPVQLAVRTADGTIERFGQVLVAGPGAGFNDTYLEDPADQRRFARAALQPQVLVSNGYNSFFNRASARANRQVLAVLADCGL